MLKNLVITFARGANGKVSYSSAMLFMAGGGHLTTTPYPYPFMYQEVFLCFSKLQDASAGLKITSGESPDTMTAQIHFTSVTYRFWSKI